LKTIKQDYITRLIDKLILDNNRDQVEVNIKFAIDAFYDEIQQHLIIKNDKNAQEIAENSIDIIQKGRKFILEFDVVHRIDQLINGLEY